MILSGELVPMRAGGETAGVSWKEEGLVGQTSKVHVENMACSAKALHRAHRQGL